MSQPHHDALKSRGRGPGYRRMVDEESVILDITETLVEAMNEAGMTREELAAHAGVHPGALQREIEGAARIPLRDLIRVAAVLGLKPKLTHAHNPR